MNVKKASDKFAMLTETQAKTLLALSLDEPSSSLYVPTLGGRSVEAQRLLEELGEAIGEPCRGIIARAALEETALDDLREIKELAKRFAARAADRQQREAAVFLYHLAVAAAYGRYREHISSESLKRQQDTYRRLARLFRGEAAAVIFELASSGELNN